MKLSLSSIHVFILVSLFDNVISIASDSNPRPHHGKHGDEGRDWTVGQEVDTTSGTIIGHAASNVTEVSEYLGIPYAKPPVGNLRFAAPQKFESDQTIDAAAFVSIGGS
jgi:hypothetical protein